MIGAMPVRTSSIDGVFVADRQTFEDERGFFREWWRLDELSEAVGRPLTFVQANHSRSQKGVLRGLHAHPFETLIYAPAGNVFTVLADIRPESTTFAHVEVYYLGNHNRACVFVPGGIAHGYCALTAESDYVYLVTE